MSDEVQMPGPADEPAGETVAGDDSVIGRALAWSLLCIGVVVGSVCCIMLWINRLPPPPSSVQRNLVQPKYRNRAEVEIPEVQFADITEEAGITFVHENGARGEKLLPETMGGGSAFFDFDNDGDQDLLLINCRDWPWTKEKEGAATLTMALYRNDGTGHFADATPGSGLDVSFYGMGVAVGDYDNDGWVDVFISAVGLNHLFHNDEGKFTAVTGSVVAGKEDQWSTGCGWFDYDNDGDLDLFVENYIRWTREIDLSHNFTLDGARRAYGRPREFEGAFPYLYRNDGEGKFTDVSAEAGVQVTNYATSVPLPKALGLTFVDLDADARMDILMANDTVQNLVLRNLGGGKFKEIGSLVGVAFDSSGSARGAMGMDAARFRNDGALGIVIGNFSNEMTALFVSQDDPLQFVDVAIATGLGPLTRLQLTFGVLFVDYDLDGRLDLLTANGHLEEEINKVQITQHYEQPPLLFWNCGPDEPAEFLRVGPDKCGEAFGRPMVGRGATLADIDGDGDQDVLITASGARPRLLRNDQDLKRHWLRLKLIGTRDNKDAIGACVQVHLEDQVLERQVMPTRSYLSQTELPISIGLGDAATPDKVIIRWPDGSKQEVTDVKVNELMIIEQK